MALTTIDFFHFYMFHQNYSGNQAIHQKKTFFYPLNNSGAKIEGTWQRGKLIERNLTFSDGLKFDEGDDWEYCQPNDRFYIKAGN